MSFLVWYFRCCPTVYRAENDTAGSFLTIFYLLRNISSKGWSHCTTIRGAFILFVATFPRFQIGRLKRTVIWTIGVACVRPESIGTGYRMLRTNEAFSRVKIDAQLRDDGWNVLDNNSVRFEYDLPDKMKMDCVPYDRNERSLSIIAKEPSVT